MRVVFVADAGFTAYNPVMHTTRFGQPVFKASENIVVTRGAADESTGQPVYYLIVDGRFAYGVSCDLPGQAVRLAVKEASRTLRVLNHR
jgi:hypothetical protein